MQTLSVYIDTPIVCTCSAFMVLIFYVQSGGTFGELNGMPLVQMAVNSAVGEMGIHFVTFAIFAFAFSSLIGNYFYAESNIRFIKNSPVLLTVFRITCLVAIMVGCLNNFTLAWNFADITMGFMAIVNLIAILLLGKWAFKALDDYTAQKKAGKKIPCSWPTISKACPKRSAGISAATILKTSVRSLSSNTSKKLSTPAAIRSSR